MATLEKSRPAGSMSEPAQTTAIVLKRLAGIDREEGAFDIAGRSPDVLTRIGGIAVALLDDRFV